MPRQGRSGGGRAPSRPSVPSRQPAPQQTRPATTAAYPPANRTAAPPAAPAQQSSGGGSMLGNIASTAMGVAAGHGLSNMLFGGSSSSAPAEQAPQQNGVAAQGNEQQNNSWGQSCEVDAKQFTKCMDEHQGNMQICGWYLEQLKACQQAAKQY
ncbi:hypothetical protein VTL71DRAFT_3072 [Oculimacula yallundae]|uniref:CHCH domain-containing protein n=1 Tax=Oculimacula yallundae TaxID=86028 RepID=A0ABR4C7B6_9HELO